MSDLSTALEGYLGLRRSLGYKLERAGELLADFVAYLHRAGVHTITTELAIAWAALPPNAESAWPAQRLGAVRGFARYMQVIDPNTEIPPADLLPGRRRRPAPFLYADAQVTALMRTARGLYSELRSATLETFIGLLAVTGLRVGEAIRLDRDDVDFDQGLLIVRNSKRGTSRSVPLHPSTVEALRAYAARRDKLCPHPKVASFFVSRAGTRPLVGNLRTAFNELLRQAGLPRRSRRGGPRLHDMRHTFAVQTLLGWYLHSSDIEPQLPLLSTYLGHVNPSSTYWYLSATPELLAAAARRLDDTLGVLS